MGPVSKQTALLRKSCLKIILSSFHREAGGSLENANNRDSRSFQPASSKRPDFLFVLEEAFHNTLCLVNQSSHIRKIMKTLEESF